MMEDIHDQCHLHTYFPDSISKMAWMNEIPIWHVDVTVPHGVPYLI